MTPQQSPRPLGVLLSLTLVVLLAACVQPGAAPKQPGAVGDKSTPAAAAPETAAPPPVAPAPPPAVVTLTAQEVQRSVTVAIESLEGGQEELAESELRKVLQSEPNNRIAQSLMRQIKEDPLSLLGRESFAYRVQPGESLSRIAQRFIGNDALLFYALARYNNIKVPRSVAGGQLIRVPGRAPAAQPTAQPSPQPATSATTPAPAPTAMAVPATLEPTAAEIAAKRKADVERLTRAARVAMAKQDLDGAIRNWEAVLKIEPDNSTASLERQRALVLREKLGKVK